MEYKLHRVARNSDGWVRPSHGRLGKSGVGNYVKEHGFGHEDWNFQLRFATNRQMLGYTVAQPAAHLEEQKFGVILATYDPQGWNAVGYYNGATFRRQNGPYHEAAVEQMASDVFHLAERGGVAPRYRGKTLLDMEKIIRTDFIYACWIIPKDQVFVFERPVPIPVTIFNPGSQRMVTSYNLSENQFQLIAELEDISTDQDTELELGEGSPRLKLHKIRERRPELVSAFKSALKSFACVICNFDFEKRYGSLGAAFIECHHIQPVHKMRPREKTRLSDLCAVCSNCHRMLHISSPMMTPEELRNKLL